MRPAVLISAKRIGARGAAFPYLLASPRASPHLLQARAKMNSIDLSQPESESTGRLLPRLLFALVLCAVAVAASYTESRIPAVVAPSGFNMKP